MVIRSLKSILLNITLLLVVSTSIIGQTFQESNSSSFRPKPGETYIFNAWVKEAHIEQVSAYNNSSVVISFTSSSTEFTSSSTEFTFVPTGNIIDGWQRITDKFTIPTDATAIQVNLKNNTADGTSYFDDVRIFPFNGNMKSFVYDPETQRLMAELDENNYATLYEYDKEGGLVRVKKETEKGVYTIQETRSGNSKINSQ